MTAHTPGPWHVSDNKQNVLGKDGDGNRLIARCRAGHFPERSANACLIAAAPALLKECKRLRTMLLGLSQNAPHIQNGYRELAMDMMSESRVVIEAADPDAFTRAASTESGVES